MADLDVHHEISPSLGPALLALDQLDGAAGLQGRFRRLADAQRIVDEVAAGRADLAKGLEVERKGLARGLETERKAAVAEFQDSAARFFLDGAEPVKAVSRAFGSPNPRAEFADLMARMKADPEAIQGLRRAVLEHIQQRFQGNAEAGDTGALILKADQFQTFVRRNRGALNQVFGTGPAETLERIAADLKRTTRSVSGSKLPGGSDTEQIRQMGGGGSFLSHLVRGALRVGAAGGGAAGGAAVGGPFGAAAGVVAADVARLGRERGLKAVNDLIVEAMLDPQKAQALLWKVPPRDAGFLPRLRSRLGGDLWMAPKAVMADDAGLREERRSNLPAALADEISRSLQATKSRNMAVWNEVGRRAASGESLAGLAQDLPVAIDPAAVGVLGAISRRMTSAVGKGMRLLESPSLDDAVKFADGTKYQAVRGITDPQTGRVYIWDAMDGTHHWMAQELGIDPRTLRDGIDTWSAEMERLPEIAEQVGIRVPGGKKAP